MLNIMCSNCNSKKEINKNSDENVTFFSTT